MTTLNDLQQIVDQVETHETAIEKLREPATVLPVAVDFGRIVETAVNKGLPAEELGKLLAVYERVQEAAAKAAYHRALAKFHAVCPPIPKRAENAFFKVTRNGVQQNSRYASLEDIQPAIREALGQCGLAYRWTDARITEATLTIGCVVGHEDGYEAPPVEVTLPLDTKAGGTPQQKVYGVGTYCRRLSLVMALGLSSVDEDVDGNAPEGVDATRISPDDAAKLLSLLDETKADVKAFCEYFAIDKPSDLPTTKLAEAVRLLERKRKANA